MNMGQPYQKKPRVRATATTVRFVDPRPLSALVKRWRREAKSVQGWGATLRRCARELSRVLKGGK